MEELEKLDAICQRTGVSYEQARIALERANGDLITALIDMEKARTTDEPDCERVKSKIKVRGEYLLARIKEIIREGNISKIAVKDGDKTLLEIPVTAGVVSLVLFPYVSILAALGAMYREYSLVITRKKGEYRGFEEPVD